MILSVFAVAIALPHRGGNGDAKSLLEGFVAVINSKDKVKQLEFAKANCGPMPPAEERVQRWQGLAEQGAPFKIQRFLAVTDDSVKALVVDRNGEELIFDLATTRIEDQRKMGALSIAPADEAPLKDYSSWTSLQSLADDVRKDSGSPGLAIAYQVGDKSEAVASGVRTAGKPDALEIDDTLGIGSIGKPLTSTLIGLLIEDGKLDWNMTLKQALPAASMHPDLESVTLRQLMMHRAGIAPMTMVTGQMLQRIAGDARDGRELRQRCATDLLSQAPKFKPGEGYAYSNGGYVVLGHIAEKTTGVAFESLIRDRIFKPLGMDNSYAGGLGLPDGAPSGHRAGRPFQMSAVLESMLAPAGGGMFCSVRDLIRFAAAHLKGLRGEDGLLKASTVAILHESLPESGGNVRYGSGWGIQSLPGLEVSHGHNGSNGLYMAEMHIFPKSGLIAVALANSAARGGGPLAAVTAVAKRFAKG